MVSRAHCFIQMRSLTGTWMKIFTLRVSGCSSVPGCFIVDSVCLHSHRAALRNTDFVHIAVSLRHAEAHGKNSYAFPRVSDCVCMSEVVSVCVCVPLWTWAFVGKYISQSSWSVLRGETHRVKRVREATTAHRTLRILHTKWLPHTHTLFSTPSPLQVWGCSFWSSCREQKTPVFEMKVYLQVLVSSLWIQRLSSLSQSVLSAITLCCVSLFVLTPSFSCFSKAVLSVKKTQKGVSIMLLFGWYTPSHTWIFYRVPKL